MKRPVVLLGLAALLAAPALYSLTRSDEPKRSVELVSDPYRLDKIYHSMEGPFSIASAVKIGNQRCALQWVTGIETEVVSAKELRPISQEFFCHSNLTLTEHGPGPAQYNQRFGGKTHLDWRLFTLVPGRMSIELPKGFGIPVPADEPLDYVTMSLNLNVPDRTVDVRLRSKVHTIAASEPGAPTKALFRRALYVLQPQGEAPATSSTMSESHHVGAGCADSCRVNLSAVSTVGSSGAGLTAHWSVPPGHHLYTTEITPQLNLPFDTTIHYATIHVHPFARGMELRDLTTGQTIVRLTSRDLPDRLGVAHVDELKSIDGIPIRRDHRYQLTAEYDNTFGTTTDAMAILYLYLLEKTLT
ncbi:MAG: hypothetical protein ACR2FX_12295 [Chthoniobacterales bacterium]